MGGERGAGLLRESMTLRPRGRGARSQLGHRGGPRGCTLSGPHSRTRNYRGRLFDYYTTSSAALELVSMLELRFTPTCLVRSTRRSAHGPRSSALCCAGSRNIQCGERGRRNSGAIPGGSPNLRLSSLPRPASRGTHTYLTVLWCHTLRSPTAAGNSALE